MNIRFIDSGQRHSFAVAGLQSGVLSREKLPRGTRCTVEGAEEGTVKKLADEAILRTGEPFLYELTMAAGDVRIVSEISLEPVSGAQSADPLLRFAGVQLQPYTLFKARDGLRNAYARLIHDGAGLRALLSSRVDLRPHQAFVAGTVILDPRRRYVLADEVGLGKTIEAGIVIHDLLAQKPDARILILAPGALAQQWLCELYSKFGGQLFTVVDLHDPLLLQWEALRKAIVSTTYAAQRVGPALEQIEWDMVVVDEVHHLLASPTLYELVARLSRKSPSVLLLSAIPAHEREDEFLRLLALLEPERYGDYDARRHFSALYELQTQLGRGLRVLARRIDSYESGELELAEVLTIANRLVNLDIIKDDSDLRARLDAIADHAVRTDSRSEPGGGIGCTPPSLVMGQAPPEAMWSAPAESIELTRRMVGAKLRKLTHDIAERYRINRRILRNRRQRLIAQNQVAVIERTLRLEPYAPDQLELDAANAIHVLIRDVRNAGLDRDILSALARICFQSISSPLTAAAFLHTLRKARPRQIGEEGRDLVLMGHTVGYSDWQEYLGNLFGLVKQYVPEDSLVAAQHAVAAWASTPSLRILHLLRLLNEYAALPSRPKLLVFAGYPGFAAEVLAAVRREFGAEAVIEFRAELEPQEKEHNALRFAQNAEAWIMVSDESGGEGRNFQFANEIIHVDTPWHTARVEQRIGRLDRLGREEISSDVRSVVLYNEEGLEAALIRCLDEGIGVYHKSISGLEFALGKLERDLLLVAIDEGRDGLMGYPLVLRQVVDRERADDESEAVLDEASFERSAAARYRSVVRSDRSDQSIELATLTYLRELTWNRGVHDLEEPGYPRQVWRIRPETTQYGALPVDSAQAQGLTGVFDGTFRRSIAQRRPSLHFFSIGDPLFDSVIRSLDVQPTGRTYAIECVAPGVEPWLGFEFNFLSEPDLTGLGDSAGLVNRARSAFVVKTTRVFVSIDGAVHRDGDDLLAIRRRCEFKNRGKAWWDLADDNRSAVLRAGVEGIDWQDLVLRSCETAQQTAHSEMIARRGDEIRSEIARLTNVEQQLLELGIRGDRGATADAADVAKVIAAIQQWHPVLDSVGFLSINGRLRFLAAPR